MLQPICTFKSERLAEMRKILAPQSQSHIARRREFLKVSHSHNGDVLKYIEYSIDAGSKFWTAPSVFPVKDKSSRPMDRPLLCCISLHFDYFTPVVSILRQSIVIDTVLDTGGRVVPS